MKMDELSSKMIEYFDINLNQHHLFEYEGGYYLVVTDTLETFKVSKMEAKIIAKASYSDIPMVSHEHIKVLEKYNLSFEYRRPNVRYTRNSENLGELPIFSISINVAQNCNLSCKYCYGVDGEYGNKGKMEINDIEKSVSLLFEKSEKRKNINISFFGGEPLLNFSAIKKCVLTSLYKAKKSDKRLRFSISTNGLLLNKDVISFFKKYDFSIQISLDGDKKKTLSQRPMKNGHDYYSKLLSNIKHASSEIKNVLVRSTVLTQEEVKNTSEYFESIGINNYEIKVATLHQNIIVMTGNEKKDSINKRSAIKTLQGIKTRQSYLLNMTTISLVNTVLEKRKRYFGCDAAKGSIAIANNGVIYPCHRFVGEPDEEIGSILLNGFERELFQRSRVDKNPICSSCWAKFYCGGGCMHDHKVSTGDKFKPSKKFCRNVYDMYKSAIYVANNLDDGDMSFLNSNMGLIPGHSTS